MSDFVIRDVEEDFDKMTIEELKQFINKNKLVIKDLSILKKPKTIIKKIKEQLNIREGRRLKQEIKKENKFDLIDYDYNTAKKIKRKKLVSVKEENDKQTLSPLTNPIDIKKSKIANKKFQTDLNEVIIKKYFRPLYREVKISSEEVEDLFISAIMNYIHDLPLKEQKQYGWNGKDKLKLDWRDRNDKGKKIENKQRDFFEGSLYFGTNNFNKDGLADGMIRDLGDFNNFMNNTKEIKNVLDLVIWDTKWTHTSSGGDIKSKDPILQNIMRYNDFYFIYLIREKSNDYKFKNIEWFNWNRLNWDTFTGLGIGGKEGQNTITTNPIKHLRKNPIDSQVIFDSIKNKLSLTSQKKNNNP